MAAVLRGGHPGRIVQVAQVSGVAADLGRVGHDHARQLQGGVGHHGTHRRPADVARPPHHHSQHIVIQHAGTYTRGHVVPVAGRHHGRVDPTDLPPDVCAELDAGLGPGGVLARTEDLAAYESGSVDPGGAVAAVVRPRSTDQVRTVLRWAREHRVQVLAQGANTGLVGASTPPPGAQAPLVVLSTELMVDGLVVDPTDRTAVVPAGLRLSTLNDVLSPHGLWFPIDLAADPTLGGMVATNTGGAWMLRHGDVRRGVLGVEVVTADEDVTVLDTLSVLRKDNTGPDLTSLFVGSAGMFGVVCRVALDLARIPAHTAGMVVVPADGAAAVDLLTGLEEDLGDLLSAFEVMSAPAMDAALRHVDGLHHPFGGSPLPDLAVLVEVAGPVGLDDLLLERWAGRCNGGWPPRPSPCRWRAPGPCATP